MGHELFGFFVYAQYDITNNTDHHEELRFLLDVAGHELLAIPFFLKTTISESMQSVVNLFSLEGKIMSPMEDETFVKGFEAVVKFLPFVIYLCSLVSL